MAIVKCQECNNEVSDKASTCPHCGYKLKTINYKRIIAIVSVCIVLLGSIGVVYYIQNSKPAKYSTEAYNYGKEAIAVVDKYLDDVYDYDKADSELSKIKEELEELNEQDNDTNTYLLKVDIFLISSDMLTGSKTDVLNARNGLATELNLKKK